MNRILRTMGLIGLGALCSVGLAADLLGCDVCSEARSSSPLAPREAVASLTLPDLATDVQHYQLAIDLDIPARRLAGRCTIFARARADDVTSMDIRLSSAFIATAIQNERTIFLERLDPATLRVHFDRPYKDGQLITIEIAYSGQPPQGEGFGSILFTTKSNGAPHVSTLSEPWYAYTWWPAKDLNADKATIDIQIGVPVGLSVAANGLPMEVTTSPEGLLRYRFMCRYPMSPYLVAFSVADYASWRRVYAAPTGSMPVDFMVFPESDTTERRAAWDRSLDMLAAFRPVFGEYPFLGEKYGIYQFGFGGGMEHQTMSGQGGWGESLTAHELAHQWWGDLVTCDTWSDIWLNEGFATYAEALWAERQPGSSGLPALKAAMQSRRPGSVDGTVYIPNPTSVGRIFSGNFSYRKAGWVLHMLRKIAGDSTFFAILAEHRARHRFATATTEEFIATAEDVSGGPLRWFFDPWLFEVGAPKYRWGTQVSTVGGRDYLLVSVEQTQSPSWPTFEMPLDVHGSGFNRTLRNKARVQHYVVPITQSTGDLALDPDGWVLHTGIERAAYLPGPPVIVESSPAHFDTSVRALREVSIGFHVPVMAQAQDFLVRGSRSGPVRFSLRKLDEGRKVALVFARPLAPDLYTVTVRDTVVGSGNAMKLDGENLGAWPSGDGLSGGSSTFFFIVKTLR